MLVEAIGPEQVYPNDQDLAARPHGWYPGPKEFVEILRSGQTHRATIFIGHFPFVIREEFDSDPLTVTLLREPTARTLSMLKHRKLKSTRATDASYEQLLNHTDFVDRQIRDYQTKIFAFDSIEQCPDTVNVALKTNEGHIERAIDRLRSVDILGVIEDFQLFCARFTAITGIGLRSRRDNANPLQNRPHPHEAQRIKQLTQDDRLLYQRAVELTS